MEFRTYKLPFIIRLSVLVLGLIASVYSIFILQNSIRSIFSVAICVISIAELFNFLNRMNNEFKTFLQALIYEDFSNYYSSKRKDKAGIYNLFNQLNSKYKKIALEKEIQFTLIKNIIEHISIGIIVLDQDDKLVLNNTKLLTLFKCNKISALDKLFEKYPSLEEQIEKQILGKPELVELNIDGELLKISLNISRFKLEGVLYKLISFQDINVELDEQELLSWQKLIRVLTHEIMNSVTPISSLSSSLNALLSKSVKDNRIEQKQLDYLKTGLDAVQERSEGLLKFSESYKKLTQLKHPDYIYLNVGALFENVLVLYKSKIDKCGIKTEILIDSKQELLADKFMIEQVLINLVKNSIEAISNLTNPSLTLRYFKENERLTIKIIDNGMGITSDKLDKIFIPFFTTKEKGSGIGLSFVRQVMRLHRGNVLVKSQAGETIFTLKF
ncbi:MAG: HAMP domain-containing histidine kinase [Bacteroidales bacterium]|nr:HAMP domain-containing histidine kinase [Bacteroidales bacterium]